MSRQEIYALVDVNNCYVSCERLFNPKLNYRPVIVLSNNDGCAVARSQEAKDLGIKMGVPLFQIKDIVKQHNEPYRVCRRLNILRDYSDEKTKLYPRN